MIKYISFLFIFFSMSLFAQERISYTGRLVQGTGAPKTGPIDLKIDILTGNSAPLTQQCTKTLTSVPLSNGIFNVEIDYVATCTGSKQLSEIIQEAHGAIEKVWIKVTEDPSGTPVIHSEQQVLATPLAIVALKASGLSNQSINELAFNGIAAGCANGEVLKSDGAGSFNCAADSGGGGSGDMDAVNTPAGSGLAGGATTGTVNLSIALDGTTLEKTATGLKIRDGAITATHLATGTVSSAIGAGSIDDTKLATDSVIEAKIQNGAVTANKIGAGAVTVTKLGTDAVETAKIKDLNVTEAKLATGSVTATKIGSDAVTAAKIQSQSLKDIAGITHLLDEMFISNGTNIIATSIPTCAAGEVLTFKRPPFAAFGCVIDASGGPGVWTDTGSVVYYNGGSNVGIGTATPSAKLDVNGDVIFQGNTFDIKNSGTVTTAIETTDTGRALQLYRRNGSLRWDHGVNVNSAGTNDFHFREDGSNIRMTIQDVTGNIGIGTESPQSILELSSTSSGLIPPRMTQVQRDAITANPGEMIYNTDENSFNYWDGTAWSGMGSSSGTSGSATYYSDECTASECFIAYPGVSTLSGALLTLTVTVSGDYLVAGHIDARCSSGATTSTQSAFASVFYHINGVADRSIYNMKYESTTNSVKRGNSNGSGSFIKTLTAGDVLTVEMSGRSCENTFGFADGSSLAAIKLIGSGGGGALTADSVTSSEIADNAVTSSEIDDGTVTGTDLATDTVTIANVDFASSDGLNIPTLGSDPTATVEGQMYYNTATDSMMVYDGSTWNSMSGGSSVWTQSATDAYYMAGNVGIGTTTPTHLLTLQDSDTSTNHDAVSSSAQIRIINSDTTNNNYSELQFFNGNRTAARVIGKTINHATDEGALIIATTDSSSLNTEKMRVTGNGNVGIGLPNPSEKLEVSGNIIASGFIQPSDRRLKREISSVTDALSIIKKLEGVGYFWRMEEFQDMNLPEGYHYGVIAQEIEKIIPEAVYTKKDGLKGVNYQTIIPFLIEAIKELDDKQSDRRQQLESEIIELKKQNKLLRMIACKNNNEIKNLEICSGDNQ